MRCRGSGTADATPMYANVHHKNGREQNAYLCKKAPCPQTQTTNVVSPAFERASISPSRVTNKEVKWCKGIGFVVNE